jgi:anaerobic magnesium-protoporphyrin IX monomethyl ester cyclase
MVKKLLLIRTHKNLNAGGAVPPIGLLYLASAVIRKFPRQYEIKIVNAGLMNGSPDLLRNDMASFRPDIAGLSAMTCEADLMAELAGIVKASNKDCVVIAGGPHATLAKEKILEDGNIDFGVIGEGEETLAELLAALGAQGDCSLIRGLALRNNGRPAVTAPRDLINDVDGLDIVPEAWGLIDAKAYGGFANWNGVCRNTYYLPVITSRGCPFKCFFCRSRDIWGGTFRARSPESVVAEIAYVARTFGVKEIHFYDDVFNFDAARAKRICDLIVAAGLRLDLAFPNGLRADLMTADLIRTFKKAGVYKINYGIESASVRIQRTLGKELDIERVEKVIGMTVDAGIIAAGYFIFGFPGETRQDILETIDFAGRSRLDNAFFFKFTDYSAVDKSDLRGQDLSELHFHSSGQGSPGIAAAELNELIFRAQQVFYGNFRRLWRSFVRSPRKTSFARDVCRAFPLIILSYLMVKLGGAKAAPSAGRSPAR